MKKYIYAYRDKKLGSYLDLLTASEDHKKTSVLVARSLQAITDEKVKSHCKDLEFYALGEYDTESGIITGYDKPEFILNCDEFIIDEK